MSVPRSCASYSELQSLQLKQLPVADPKVRESLGSSSTSPSRQKWLIEGIEPAAKLLKLAVGEERRCETMTALKQTGLATLKHKNPQIFCHSGCQSSKISAEDEACCELDHDYCNRDSCTAIQRTIEDVRAEMTLAKEHLEQQKCTKEILCCIEQARSAIAERLKNRFPEIFQRLDQVRQVRGIAQVMFSDWLLYEARWKPVQMDIFKQIGVIAQELFEIEPAQWTLIRKNYYGDEYEYEYGYGLAHVRTATTQETLQMVEQLEESAELKAALKKVIGKLDSIHCSL